MLARHALPLLRRQARDRAPHVAAELDRIAAARGRRRRTPSRRSPTPSSRVVVTGARELRGHDALQFLLAHEPEAVLGHLAFGPGDRRADPRSATRSRPRSTAGCPTTTPRAPATGSPASCVRTCSCRIHPSTSPTPPPLARSSTSSSFPASTRNVRQPIDWPYHTEHHRSRRHRRLRRDPRRHQHRRRRGRSTRSTPTPTRSSRGTTSAAAPRWRSSTRRPRRRSGTPTTSPGTSTSTRRRWRGRQPEPERHRPDG